MGNFLDLWRQLKVFFSIRLGLFYLKILKRTGRISAGHEVTVRGIPIIDIQKGAVLRIGERVTLNSSSVGYHLNMFAPVKLMADQKGAVIEIGEDSRVHGSCIHAKEYIGVGARCLIAANCQIMDSNGHDVAELSPETRIKSTGYTKPVFIEDDVWLGVGVVVLPGARIGRGSVVGAGSIVSGDIPPMCFAGGTPCRVLRSFSS